MSCVESLLADLEQLMGTAGQGLSDIVILCEAEEIKVHRLILGARYEWTVDRIIPVSCILLQPEAESHSKHDEIKENTNIS